MDPNDGKVHRESKRGTQHYLICGWRGVNYKLTGRFAYWGSEIASEYEAEDGTKLWGSEEGWYPDKQPKPDAIWTETIAWIK